MEEFKIGDWAMFCKDKSPHQMFKIKDKNEHLLFDYERTCYSKSVCRMATAKEIGYINQGKESEADQIRPQHYGGADNPYECIKVIRAWELGFELGNVLKYISRAGKKDNAIKDLEKAKAYLEMEIKKRKAL